MQAPKLLNAIEESIAGDQGAAYRVLLGQVIPTLTDAYRGVDSPFRSHLGGSLIGRECPREVWYGFRWATIKKFDGRILRLFNRGHLEEARFIAILKAVGVTTWEHEETGEQYRISGVAGHFGGSLDSIVFGVPDMPTQYMLAEYKTHSSKSFEKLKKEGLIKAKFEHYVQMNIYMGAKGLKFGLYLAVNKDNDELYAEVIPFDVAVYQRYWQRAVDIITADKPPARINESSSFFVCKMCDHRSVCHGKILPAMNCRTCDWSFPSQLGNALWLCKRDNTELSKTAQEKGCGNWRVHMAISATT